MHFDHVEVLVASSPWRTHPVDGGEHRRHRDGKAEGCDLDESQPEAGKFFMRRAICQRPEHVRKVGASSKGWQKRPQTKLRAISWAI